MVYESDFYTTRRPYRSTYSVTPLYSSYYLPTKYLPYYSAYYTPYIISSPKLSQPLYSSYLSSKYLPYYSSYYDPYTLSVPKLSKSLLSAYYVPSKYVPYYSAYYDPYVSYMPKLSQPLLSDSYFSSKYLPYYSAYYDPYLFYTPPKLSQAELIYRPSRPVTRLVTYPDIPHHIMRVRVRPSVYLRELDRIAYRRRPAFSISAVDDFLRSNSTKAFEDETRRIRADTASVLRRARSTIPRAKSFAPLDTIYHYSYGEPMPYRFSNDAYIEKLLVPLRSVSDHIRNMSYYNEPASRFTGRGHLACIHYSGNKGFSNRRPLYKELSIRDDVNLLSFYAKNRLAASGLAIENATANDAPEQATAA